MVTTRSRGIKPEPGLDTATGHLPTAASGQLKRKNSDSSATADVPKKMTKSGLDDLDSDLSAEAKLPSAPAPTPAIGNLNSTTAVHEAPPLLDGGNSTITLSHGQEQALAPSVATATSAPAPVSAPVTATTTTMPLAPVQDDSITAALETVKEPEPQFAPLPELDTVLDEPHQNTTTSAAPSLSTPAAPTAPEFSTIPAPAPVLAAPGPASGASTTSTEDPTLHQQQTKPLPSQMHALNSTNAAHLAQPSQNHHNGGAALGDNGHSNGGLLSSSLAGIDHANNSANALAGDTSKGYGNGREAGQNDPSSEPFVLKPPSNALAGPFTSQI
ncbi:hypothetical protein BGZ70_003728 [Mortierella alpina]|uniref:Uncharacterized protein n=1 Tax=Mortierella alpina TaxID=64518 RepID=A0A9P6IRW8_MORAP|nr:hypothetical protein BGZ70_003728 [Mortierella alpina]